MVMTSFTTKNDKCIFIQYEGLTGIQKHKTSEIIAGIITEQRQWGRNKTEAYQICHFVLGAGHIPNTSYAWSEITCAYVVEAKTPPAKTLSARAC